MQNERSSKILENRFSPVMINVIVDTFLTCVFCPFDSIGWDVLYSLTQWQDCESLGTNLSAKLCSKDANDKYFA